jgi:hypothetical protein
MSGTKQELNMKKSMSQTHSYANHPPSMQDVKIYFNQKGMPECEANEFYQFYERKQWTSKKGCFFKDWKQIAYRWIAKVVISHPSLFDRRIH